MKPPFGRSLVLALLLAPGWIALGYFLLLRYVHSEGLLLWLSQALLLPDLLLNLAVPDYDRDRLWVIAMVLDLLYVWLVVYLAWWAVRALRKKSSNREAPAL